MEPPTRRPSALFDTNVALDVLLDRLPFSEESSLLWKKCDDGILNGYLAAVSVTTIFYVARKLKGLAEAQEAVSLVLRVFHIVPVHRDVLESARLMPGSDFEDNVQIACAAAASVECIVSRDTVGFKQSPIRAVTPRELLELADPPHRG